MGTECRHARVCFALFWFWMGCDQLFSDSCCVHFSIVEACNLKLWSEINLSFSPLSGPVASISMGNKGTWKERNDRQRHWTYLDSLHELIVFLFFHSCLRSAWLLTLPWKHSLSKQSSWHFALIPWILSSVRACFLCFIFPCTGRHSCLDVISCLQLSTATLQSVCWESNFIPSGSWKFYYNNLDGT